MKITIRDARLGSDSIINEFAEMLKELRTWSHTEIKLDNITITSTK